MGKNITFNYGSLNCNSLVKTQSPTTQSSYIRFLKEQSFDILSLQETHATSSSITTLNMQFQARQTIWTHHCGIVSFSTDYILTQISTDQYFSSERFILSKVHHPHQFYTPFYILNIYAPASSNAARRSFFQSLYDMLLQITDIISLDRLIISGDFNYDNERDIESGKGLYKTAQDWVFYMQHFFDNCMLHNNMEKIPTFQRVVGITSTIDYVYAGINFTNSILDASVQYIKSNWSDHSILNVTFDLGSSKMGPGLWRGNPSYASNPAFQKMLAKRVDQVLEASNADSSPQQLWEKIKKTTKHCIKSFGIRHVSWRKSSLKQLERKRNRLLRSKPPQATLLHFLPRIDSMISILQQEIVDIKAMKSGITWREKGEKSAKYLKSIHHQRTTQQYMSCLQQTETITTNPSDIIPLRVEDDTRTTIHATTKTSDMDEMRISAQGFYQSLYTKDHVEDGNISLYLADVTFERTLAPADKSKLMEPIDLEQLLTQASRRSTKYSSPGADGLAYPFLALLFQLPSLKVLVVRLYNEALQGIFPISWQDIRVRLLPKKGDLSSLRNWRPISLINCDAKVFTRLITKRLGPIVKKIINPYQSGFVPGRFIGDNGLALSLILEQARGFNCEGVGILLDQEKAYDRVHPRYLCRVLDSFGFPHAFIHCIESLFFGNTVYVNINGFFTDAINQERGLRQGDPLSPLLFNLALEPFLLSLLQDQDLEGFVSPTPSLGSTNTPSTPFPSQVMKCLAYADDVCVFLKSADDLDSLQYHMQRYANASNAKFNDDKSEAFSLNGQIDTNWISLLAAQNILKYYHQGSPQVIRYLGFYLPYTTAQRAILEAQLLATIRTQCQVYSQRQMSIKGRVTIMNILILSKLWYCLRLFKPTKKFFRTARSIIYQFVWQKKTPRLRKDLLFLPLKAGGLMVLDPVIQHKILQKRWLNYLIQPKVYYSFVYDLMITHLSYFDKSASYPLLPLYDPDFRSGRILHKDLSIWHVIFSTFDYFGSTATVKLVDVPIATILSLPLHKLLENTTDSHWTKKHPKFEAHLFMVFDEQSQRLRLKVIGEFTRYPRLCQSLFQDILHSRRVKLVDFVWTHILNPPSTAPIDWASHPIDSQMRDNHLWSSFKRHDFRQHYQTSVETTSRFSPNLIKSFWSSAMYPQARTVYYRVLSKCIPTKHVLSRYGSVSSLICSLCHTAEDNLKHFLVDCPPKREIWHRILSQYFPHLLFTPGILYDSLRYLKLPASMKHSRIYLPIISTILWQLWNLYWQHGNDNELPLTIKTVDKMTPRIVSHIEALLHPRIPFE